MANRPQFLSKDFLRPYGRRSLGPPREKARHTRGEDAQASGCLSRLLTAEGKGARILGECAHASGCLSHSQRREKARSARGEAAETSGCPGRSPRREKACRARGESAHKPLAA